MASNFLPLLSVSVCVCVRVGFLQFARSWTFLRAEPFTAMRRKYKRNKRVEADSSAVGA